MPITLSRRRRNVAVTTALGGAFVVATAVVVLAVNRPSDGYLPGGEVAGLTSALHRGLPDDVPDILFTDVTAEAGITFRHFPGERTTRITEDMGSGAAWGDFDNDGWPDLFLVNYAQETGAPETGATTGRTALYRNNRDGTFADVSVEAGLSLRVPGMGAAWADYDNDGWLDLIVTTVGHLYLFRNNGNGTFDDVTRHAGMAAEEGFWAGASWGDYDRDGHVDVYITGYVRYADVGAATSLHYDAETPASLNPSSFAPERNLLFRNNGDGTFSEMGALAGVANEQGRSLAAAWTDLDEDGWPDLYVANDVSDNVLFHNQRNGSFDEISHRALVADYRGAMGLAVGDWDGDGDTDIFVTHWIAQENALYNNQRADRLRSSDAAGVIQFMDVADRFGVGQIALDYIGWGTSFFDFDNDGRLDLVVANGSTFQRTDDRRFLVPMRDQLFWNRGAREGFYDVSSVAGTFFERAHVGRGAAVADFDNDGDLDLLIMNHGEAPALLRNDGGEGRAWLQIALVGVESNRSALGARIRLVADGRTQHREIGAQSSYLSHNSLVAHFGLDTQTVADSIEVRWPSGRVEVRTSVPSNQTIVWVEGAPL